MVTIPTIDQISGTTVMNKLRSLIRKFIEFATDVSDEMDYVAEQSQEAYNMASSIDLTNYYTKTEVDNLIAGIDLSDYYTKTEINATFTNYYTKTDIDTALALKQDNLTATTPIKITNNNISFKDWIIYNNEDWTVFVDENNRITEDIKVVFKYNYSSTGSKKRWVYVYKDYYKGEFLGDTNNIIDENVFQFFIAVGFYIVFETRTLFTNTSTSTAVSIVRRYDFPAIIDNTSYYSLILPGSSTYISSYKAISEDDTRTSIYMIYVRR